MKLDAALAEATGVTLEDFPKSAEEFEKTTGRFGRRDRVEVRNFY